MIELMTAGEARRKAEYEQGVADERELAEIATKIKDATRDGKFSIYLGFVSLSIRQTLRDYGYIVEVGSSPYNEDFTKISW